MASNDDVIRIIANFEGEEEGKRLAAATALAEQKFRELYASLGAGDAKTKAAAAGLSDLQGKLKSVGGSSQQAGQLLTQAGYAVDDLQFGFKGIANNIQPILQNIPGLGTLAPVLSIAAIAAYQLWEHSGQIAELFGMGSTKTEADRMEELGKKTSKTADETARLAKYERERSALTAQEQSQTPAQKAQQGGVNEAIADAGFGKVDQIIKDQIRTAVTNSVPGSDKLAGLKARQAELATGHAAPEVGDTRIKESIQEIEEAIAAKLDEQAREIRKKIGSDPAALKAFTDRLVAAGKNGDDFVHDLRQAQKTPKELEAEKNALLGPDQIQLQNEQFEIEAKRKARARAAEQENIANSVDPIELANQQAKIEAERQARARDLADEKTVREDDQAIKAEDQAREDKKFIKQNRIDQAARATAGTGLDDKATDAFLRNALSTGGNGKRAQAMLEAQLKREYMANGLSGDAAQTAAVAKAKEVAEKTAEGINQDARNPQKNPAQRIGTGDFARSVESAGAKEMLDVTKAMRDRLVEIVQQGNRGARAS